jgi:hypothetical protein
MDDSTHQPMQEPEIGDLPETPDSPTPDAAPSERHDATAVQTLRQAMRRARHDDAERNGLLLDQRVMRVGRLEVLLEALAPLLSQIPRDVDLFDVGIMPGATPRLFIDMIGFIEMGRDARVYRFVQDTRHGRIRIAESADVEIMVDAVTDYIARRLLERDKALASDTTAPHRDGKARPRDPIGPDGPPVQARSSKPVRRTRVGWFGATFAFLIDLLGSIAFFVVLAGIGWLLWNRWYGQS